MVVLSPKVLNRIVMSQEVLSLGILNLVVMLRVRRVFTVVNDVTFREVSALWVME